MFNNEPDKSIRCKYSGPFGDYTGYGEANRNAIMALDKAGVQVTTNKISYTSTEAEYGQSYRLAEKLEGKPMKYDIKILHVPSDGYLKFLEPTKYHIGHLFWETDGMSKTWVWNCNLMDEIWTGGHVHKDNFQKAGVKVPIFVYPQSNQTDLKVQRPFNIPGHKGYLFYSIFQWIERKNPKALLNAYWKEFQGQDDVTLLLKVYRFGFDENEHQQIRDDIISWKKELGMDTHPRVLLYFGLMSKSDIMRLHWTGDCFVSAHRGEGWGIPQVEASIVGNPMISTDLGGCHEWYEDGKTAFLTKWKKEKVFNMDFAPWYGNKQSWAKVSEKDLRRKLRFVYENREEAKDVGLAAQRMVKDKFSYVAVGNLMRDRLRDIQRLIK